MTRPIAISLSPNTETDDILLAFRVILKPWSWFDTEKVKMLEKQFADRFGLGYKAIAVNSGRAAEELILRALQISETDEVIVQGFTCVAVPNSVRWVGAKPVYGDIDENYSMTTHAIREITREKTRAIIVQHSFGIPVDIKMIKKSTRKDIAIIEDCAISLGAQIGNKEVGTLGDVAFFSFGRDKILSSVFGGMVLTKNESLFIKLMSLRDGLPQSSFWWTLQQLLHPVLMSVIVPTYNAGLGRIKIGRILLYIFQRTHLLSKAVYPEEQVGGKPFHFPAKMPGALAMLALLQLKKLDRFNNHRKKIAEYYRKELFDTSLILPPVTDGSVWLRFPVRHPKAAELFSYLRSRNIVVGDWYKKPVVPTDDLSKIGYIKGSCPVAEEYASTIINLPTYPSFTLSDAKKVVDAIKQWIHTT